MELSKLGDALDSWKGAMFGEAQAELRPLYVVPMLTDAADWNPGHVAVYANMLGVPVEHILLADRPFTNAQRNQYFDDAARPLPRWSDVFVDPNAGPCVGRPNGHPANYVKCAEINTLLIGGRVGPEERDRVVLVYRHQDRNQDIDGLAEYVGGLAGQIGAGCSGFAVLCGITALLTFSYNKRRLVALRDLISRVYGPVAISRVTGIQP